MAGGFLSGFMGGLGQVANQQANKIMELRNSGYQHMADLYGRLAESYQDQPDLMNEFLSRAGVFSRAMSNPYDRQAHQEAQKMGDPGEPIRNFADKQAHQKSQQYFGQPAQPDMLLNKKNAAPVSGALTGQPSSASQPIKQSGAPDYSQQQSPPDLGAQGPPTGAQSFPIGGVPPQQAQPAPQPPMQGPPQPQQAGHPWDAILSNEAQNKYTLGPGFHPVVSDMWTAALKSKLEYDVDQAKRQSMLDYMKQVSGGGMGGALRPVDNWRMQRAAYGDTSADQYATGTWNDQAGTHLHEKVTLSAGKAFDRAGNEIPPSVPINFSSPRYTYDGQGNLVEVGEVKAKTPDAQIKKPSITRKTNRQPDLYGKGSSATSVISYGTDGVGNGAAPAPQKARGSARAATTSSGRGAITAPPGTPHMDVLPPAGVTPTAAAPGVPPEIQNDPRFKEAVSSLVERRASLADYPNLKPYLVAAMPPDVRAAENPADLERLVSADFTTSLIQGNIKRLRAIADPKPGGKSILDDPSNRAIIRATLHPAPTPDNPGLYGQTSAFLIGSAQDALKQGASGEVLSYVATLRQLRDDILSLRGILKGAPMRSNAQMNIQLAQVPDENISGYREFDKVLRAYEFTPTAVQNIQKGTRPSAPGTSSSVDAYTGLQGTTPSGGKTISKLQKNGNTFYWQYANDPQWYEGPQDPRTGGK